ncbi:DUF7344 domain-containing protein [Halorussus litoreus]|uniref:DUF7344 domain-containing protein n=1 Tax=Halorussus litoreus TaxID=1710536 RepID=UPI0013005812|nr:hypothetical protein [Halorussus litoreus]
MTSDGENEQNRTGPLGKDQRYIDNSAAVIAEKAKLWTNSRRQHVVRQVLAAPNREMSLRQLALNLRDHIDEQTEQDPDYDDVRQTLRRRHLPRLSEHDVVDFEDNMIRPGPEFGAAVELLVRNDPRV